MFSTTYPSQRSKRIFEDLEKKNCYGRTHGQKHNGQRVYKIDAWSTRPFAHALNRLPALLNAHCLIHSRAPLRSFLCLLARSLAALSHSLAPSLDHELMQKRLMSMKYEMNASISFSFNPLWDVNIGPATCPLTRSLARLIHSLRTTRIARALRCTHLFASLLTRLHPRVSGIFLSSFQSVLNHCEVVLLFRVDID